MMGAIPICDGVFYLHDIVEYSQCATKISPDFTVAYIESKSHKYFSLVIIMNATEATKAPIVLFR